jgi:hypothetical protein
VVGGKTVERWYSAEHNRDVVVSASFQGEGDQRIRCTGQVRERGCTGQSSQPFRGRLVIPEPVGTQQQDPWARRRYHSNMRIEAQIARALGRSLALAASGIADRRNATGLRCVEMPVGAA